MKALELLKHLLKGYSIHQKDIKEAIAELEAIQSKICCDNCQQYDSLSDVCLQNGCEDYKDWKLWNTKG